MLRNVILCAAIIVGFGSLWIAVFRKTTITQSPLSESSSSRPASRPKRSPIRPRGGAPIEAQSNQLTAANDSVAVAEVPKVFLKLDDIDTESLNMVGLEEPPVNFWFFLKNRQDAVRFFREQIGEHPTEVVVLMREGPPLNLGLVQPLIIDDLPLGLYFVYESSKESAELVKASLLRGTNLIDIPTSF